MLTERERKIKDAADAGLSPIALAKELDTTPQGVAMEHELLQKRMIALFERQAPCSLTITPERIVDAMEGML